MSPTMFESEKDERKRYRLIVELFGHSGFGATDNMISIAQKMTHEELEGKADWWDRDTVSVEDLDYGTISRIDIHEIEFVTEPRNVEFLESILQKVLRLANGGDDSFMLGGTWFRIEELEDVNFGKEV